MVTASTLAAGALAEGFLQFCFPIYSVVLGPHPRYLHALVPNSRQMKFDVTRPGFHMVRINANGHWGPEESDDDPTPRIIVYGDSFIDSHYAPIDDSYPVRLAGHLHRLLGQPVNVINAGVLGYGPDQESLRIEDDLERSRPALIVLAIFTGNDFGDLIRNKLFRLGPDGTAVTTRRIVGTEATRLFHEIGPLHLGRALVLLRGEFMGVRLWWLGRARDRTNRVEAESRGTFHPETSSEALIRSTLEARQREYQSFVVEGDDVIRSLFNDGYDFDLQLFPEAPAGRYKKALMAAVLDRIAAAARARRVPLLLLVIPSPIEVVRQPTLIIDRSIYPDFRESGPADFLQAQAQRIAIPCVNLFEPFRTAGGTSLYRPNPEMHWNSAGMDLAAQLTAERIESDHLLSGASSAGAAPPLP